MRNGKRLTRTERVKLISMFASVFCNAMRLDFYGWKKENWRLCLHVHVCARGSVGKLAPSADYKSQPGFYNGRCRVVKVANALDRVLCHCQAERGA